MDQLTHAIAERRRRKLLPDPATRRSLRERVGVSQEVVARAVGVSRPSVSRWETGTTPSSGALRRYLDVLALLAAETTSDPNVHEAAGRRLHAKAAGACRRDEA